LYAFDHATILYDALTRIVIEIPQVYLASVVPPSRSYLLEIRTGFWVQQLIATSQPGRTLSEQAEQALRPANGFISLFPGGRAHHYRSHDFDKSPGCKPCTSIVHHSPPISDCKPYTIIDLDRPNAGVVEWMRLSFPLGVHGLAYHHALGMSPLGFGGLSLPFDPLCMNLHSTCSNLQGAPPDFVAPFPVHTKASKAVLFGRECMAPTWAMRHYFCIGQ
jgi:hypothetical protein